MRRITRLSIIAIASLSMIAASALDVAAQVIGTVH
jgi:hypothetical protein